MKKGATSFTGILALALICASATHAELVRNPTQVGASFDVGQIVKGTLYDGSDVASKFKADKQQITRTGVYLTESGTYNERLSIYLTVGGLFWYALPEGTSFQTKRLQFGPGVGQAQGIYAFGSDPKDPAATLQFGLFSHKYSEAVDLGEYLYRSGTYPGVLVSGGWSYINSASYMAQGLHLTVPLLDGKLKNDFTLFMERDLEPTNDLTPGYVVSYKPFSFLELGAGAVWSHAISFEPKRLARKDPANQYSKASGLPTAIDTATAANTCNGGNASDCGYYTFKGWKTMGRVSLDLGNLLDLKGAGDFKVYSEVALLGVEDQPVYFESMSERMPIMGGITIPTFGILDQLTFEMEYHKSKFPNNTGTEADASLPLPISSSIASQYDESQYTGAALDSVRTLWEKDDVKWALYARKTVSRGVSVYAQAANDHMRHFNFTATPAGIPATNRPSDWYYVIRLEFGI
jgi:hypothetical protein